MRDPTVWSNGIHSWIGQSSWFPGFLIVKKFLVQAGILGPSRACTPYYKETSSIQHS